MNKSKGDGYYEFEIELLDGVLKNSTVEEVFYLKDLKQRKLFLSADITQETVSDAARHILQFNREDADIPTNERKPILFYLTSNGGDVDAGFTLIDIILNSATPVYTINTGYQYSMGFLIGLAGHRRYAMPHAKFLMHDGAQFVYNSGAKAQDQMEFAKRQEDRIKQYITTTTKITPQVYDAQLRKEWYMFADEAKEWGVTDYIIGLDCPIDDIV